MASRILPELDHPIVLAPMGGGPSTPALTAAVSAAGGFGFLAAGYRTPEAMQADIREVRERTDRPFGVNLFVPGDAEPDPEALRSYLERLRGEAERYGVQPGEPRQDDDGWDAKLAILREEQVAAVSFTFGCPPAEGIASLHDAGSEAWVTVTDPAEARMAEEAGADVLVLQGVEAGGHRASFVDSDQDEGLSALSLLRLVAVTTDLPLVVAGGITDGAAVAAVLVAGASAAQVGTAFLDAAEAGTHPAHRAALADERPTALTRAFSGRLARGIVNRFLTEHSEHAPTGYPHIHYATAPLRAAARERGDSDGFNLWAGQTHRLAVSGTASEILHALSEGARAAIEDSLRRTGTDASADRANS